jgi:hypothetical protein
MLVAAVAACKKSSPTHSDPSNPAYGFVPSQGIYDYKVDGTDGTAGTETINVGARRDSANGHASTMIATIGSYHDTTSVYTDGTNTITPIYPPEEFDSLAEAIRRQPDVISFTYGGWPIFQTMPNTGKVNDSVNFDGGPIHLHWVTQEKNEPPVVGDYSLSYLTGKVIASGVSVNTPAGTFVCSVWANERQSLVQAGPIAQQQDFADTIWMSPGLPFVKSTEFTNGFYYVTMLQKVE